MLELRTFYFKVDVSFILNNGNMFLAQKFEVSFEHFVL